MNISAGCPNAPAETSTGSHDKADPDATVEFGHGIRAGSSLALSSAAWKNRAVVCELLSGGRR